MAEMISVDQALNLLLDGCPILPREIVPLEQALGQVTSEAIRAKVTVPPDAMSAMDGYGVRLADVRNKGAVLKIIGEVAAGETFPAPVGPGEAVRIFTGGKIAAGCDHILIQEQAQRDGDRVLVTKGQTEKRHIRPRGIDLKTGQEILPKNYLLDGFALGVLASANHGNVAVIRRTKIALIANGNELVEPGTNLPGGKIISSTPSVLRALLDGWGCLVTYLGIASDDPRAIEEKIAEAVDADLIIPLGGASVGDYDYMKGCFAKAGFEKRFEKISVKPGKPTWYSRKKAEGDTKHVLGLPGNPASALVCAHLFVKPLVDHLRGIDRAPQHKTYKAILTQAMGPQGSREEYWRACFSLNDQGQAEVAPLSRQDSSLLSPFLRANCLIKRPAHAEAVPLGAFVDILPIKNMLPS